MRRLVTLRAGLLVVLTTCMTITMQRWVGAETIYSSAHVPQREALHRYILDNRLPEGTQWSDVGASGTNIRIGVVFLAEGIRRVLGISVSRAYIAIDTIALEATLLLLFAYLRRWCPASYALIAILYFASTLPLTYALHNFHPWDRVGVLLWIALLMTLRAGRLGWFTALLGLSVTVKYDVVVLPGLYWLCQVTRENWRGVTVRAALLFALSFGVFGLLYWLRPGGFRPVGTAAQISVNVADFVEMWKAYPPLLGLVLPFVLACIGFRTADRFVRAAAAFGAALIVPFLIGSNFAEFRAEVPVLVLLLPCALCGLQVLLADDAVPPRLITANAP